MIAEGAVRRVKEGTSAVLLQSGLKESWWADSLECYTFLRNVTDLLSDGKTPFLRNHLKDRLFHLVHWLSITVSLRKTSQVPIKFGKKVLPLFFFGYALYAGGNLEGDTLVADIEELETVDASEIYSKRLNAKEVIVPKETPNSRKTFKEIFL